MQPRKERLFYCNTLAAEFIEEQSVELIGRDWSETQFEVLEHINELLPINKLDWWHTIARGFSTSFSGESAGGYEDAFVCAAGHCATKIPYVRWGHRFCVAFALGKDFE